MVEICYVLISVVITSDVSIPLLLSRNVTQLEGKNEIKKHVLFPPNLFPTHHPTSIEGNQDTGISAETEDNPKETAGKEPKCLL